MMRTLSYKFHLVSDAPLLHLFHLSQAEVTSKQITLLAVVKALGQYLTSENDTQRSKGSSYFSARTAHLAIGVEFLSLLLERCSPDIIPQKTSKILQRRYTL
jgi:hypothetical protein